MGTTARGRRRDPLDFTARRTRRHQFEYSQQGARLTSGQLGGFCLPIGSLADLWLSAVVGKVL